MPDEYVTIQVKDLEAGDKAHMYGTLVEITGYPYHPAEFKAEFVRVPMIWDNVKCAPPELWAKQVKIQKRKEHGSTGTDTPQT